MTNIEIEDVLSSIRRLVSEDPAAQRGAARPIAPRPRTEPLVLSAAYRVAEEKRASAVVDDGAADERVVAVAAGPDQDEIADIAAEVLDVVDNAVPNEAGEDAESSAIALAPEPDAGEPVEFTAAPDLSVPNESRAHAESSPTATAQAAPTTEAVPPASGGADKDVGSAGDAISLEDRIANLEAVIGASDEEFEPDGSEDQAEHIPSSLLRAATGQLPEDRMAEALAKAAPAAVPLPEAEPPKAAAEAAGPDAGNPAQPDDERGSEPSRSAAASASGRPRDLKPALDAEADDGEPLLGHLFSADTVVFSRHQAPSAQPEAGAESQATPEGPPHVGRAGHAEETLIDEEVLRQIVASLVREELRGELGEKITRNVRRMVRREIHRALLLQEMAEDDE